MLLALLAVLGTLPSRTRGADQRDELTTASIARIAVDQYREWKAAPRANRGAWLYSAETLDGIPGRKRGVPGSVSCNIFRSSDYDHYEYRDLAGTPASLADPAAHIREPEGSLGWDSRAPGEYRTLERDDEFTGLLKSRGYAPSGLTLRIYNFPEDRPSAQNAPARPPESPDPLLACERWTWRGGLAGATRDGAVDCYFWSSYNDPKSGTRDMVVAVALRLAKLEDGRWYMSERTHVTWSRLGDSSQVGIKREAWSEWSDSIHPGRMTARETVRESYTPDVPWSESAWDCLASEKGPGLLKELLEAGRNQGPSRSGEFASRTRLLDYVDAPYTFHDVQLREGPGDIVEYHDHGYAHYPRDPEVRYLVGADGVTRIPIDFVLNIERR